MEGSCRETPTVDLILAKVDTEVTEHPKALENRRETKRKSCDETDVHLNPKRVRLFVSPESIDTVYPTNSEANTPKIGASHKWGKQELDILGVTFVEEPFDLAEITGDINGTWSPELESCKIKYRNF